MKTKITYSKNTQSGFSLIEMAITLVLVGLATVAALTAYNTWQTKKLISDTTDRAAAINKAIESYIQANLVLPCPARLDVAIDNAANGYNQQTNCAAAAPSGVTDVAGRAGLLVRIGGVPVRTLNLPDDFAYDGWGNRYILAVTKIMAETPANYRVNAGAIFMRDSSGNPAANNGNILTKPDGAAMYVLLSAGPDGVGGYKKGQTTAPACAGTAPQIENCDNDAYFTKTLVTATAGGNNQFDDYVSYVTKDFIKLSAINRYTIEPFSCAMSGAPDYGANYLGENCATFLGNGASVAITAVETPVNGALLYTKTFTSQTDGRVIARAVLPITTSNATLPGPVGGPNNRWEQAIHAAIYIDGVQVGESVIHNPAGNNSGHGHINEGEGFSGLVMGNANITMGTNYTVSVYVYSYGNATVPTRSLSAGTIRHSEHSGDAMIELLEVRNL